MNKKLNPRHTKIIQEIDTGDGIIIREDPNYFPEDVPTIYKVDYTGKIIWEAERPLKNDQYVNPILFEGGKLQCATWQGFTCTLDPSTGQLLDTLFTK